MKDLQPHIVRQRLLIETNLDHAPGPTEIYEFASELADILNMTRLEDSILKYHQNYGWCCWTPWVESGSMLYTFEKEKFVTLYIDTCKPFDVDKCLNFIREFFSPLELEYKEI